MTRHEHPFSVLDLAEASFNVLFEQLSADGAARVIASGKHRAFLNLLRLYLRRERAARLSPDQGQSALFRRGADPDAVDALNALARLCRGRSFGTVLDDALFESLLRLNAGSPLSPEWMRAADKPDSVPGRSLRHAMRFARALAAVLKSSAVLKKTPPPADDPDRLPRLTPEAGTLSLRGSVFPRATVKALTMELAARCERSDPFAQTRTFRYQAGSLVPVELKSVRPIQDFFGYSEAKNLLQEHFAAFVNKQHNLPLLLSGLPGLGKTQMTIAYALSFPSLTLILPAPDALEAGLEGLIENLSRAPHHRFIVFFDDIDTRNVNWYYFRTHVGGSFALPQHIMVVIASNYRFPPNISSRGRTFTFPLFDEIRCQEMIEDLFLARGMKQVPPQLLMAVAADYVESFGQKVFDELSPRTLARYLELYLADTEKRILILKMSRGEVVTRPDPQAFYAQNLKLLRALYGKEAIDEIREKELSGE